ncbi:hypothetical protein E6P09_11745 [Haloferax mediterranei ATCC 33500]|uniref:Small CPxCG-related zinc finger protein n=1 Tax=Haloferax mediterranei (strain ATCC 33500 / DSM 1411 / JCM 8866 / NBRC 14739 / NCIMB 2177 / R-4) TaxID=523841 RepID=I3R5D8_HALMT|nr:hypothetical protein [Haloferax mediterranei]AFK19448.1 hypothetical protein HFX_1742 [Haloferax mediterranei ATCC 33500]MDX5989551.1 hypothetical protein [Haloferax mediterranei ATCC 33500]QCQ75909.1 hypothetical protein E6P09_11745 [Haloferax mediterranei ATCC 33500]
MSRTSRFGRSHPGPEWRISHRATRTDWSDAVERCATCHTDIDMREAHYQVVLDRDIDHSGKLSFERQRVVFCDEACADQWESHA